ncbi:MAG: hypothetical protein P8Y15_14140, partial [Gemmatimonadales bacterium]
MTEGYTRRRAIRGDGIEIPQRTVAKGAGAYGPTGAPEARVGISDLLGAGAPEALVIAGDWDEIPFRFPYGLGGASATSPP